MKRRLVAILLAAGMVMSSLAGCGQSVSTNESTEEKVESTSTGTVESTAADNTGDTAKEGPITTDPITISILMGRHAESISRDANDLWFFKYLEYWMNEQGYNITLEVETVEDEGQQIPLLLGTNSLPDLIWGIGLSTSNAVSYGAGQGLILDWKPYINEELMPNLYALMQAEPDAEVASTCIDGGIYGLPRFGVRSENAAAGNMPPAERVYINQNWLDECNLERPTTMDEFLDMLRIFKDNIQLDGGKEVIPLISVAEMFEKYVWTSLGYYGSVPTAYGNSWMIKDEQLVWPAASEDYRTFIEIMKTCYDEGLMSMDHLTMDENTARGFMTDGVAGVICDWTLGLSQPETFADWVSALPVAAGDNDQVVASANATYTLMSLWASAETKYPEVVAAMVDHVYSREGGMYYNYGPKQGEDPVGILDGWYYVEKNGVQTITCDLVEDGTYTNFDTYCKSLIYPSMYVGNCKRPQDLAMEMAGLEVNDDMVQMTDAVTGKQVALYSNKYDEKSVGGWWAITTTEAWKDSATTVMLPTAYLSEEDTLRASELSLLLNDYVRSESAKFITGARPVSEIDDYFKELDKLGMQEYKEIYEAAYGIFMTETFK